MAKMQELRKAYSTYSPPSLLQRLPLHPRAHRSSLPRPLILVPPMRPRTVQPGQDRPWFPPSSSPIILSF